MFAKAFVRVVIFVLERSTTVSDVPPKAPVFTVFKAVNCEKLNCVKDLQFWKAVVLIVVRLAGDVKLTLSKAVQLANIDVGSVVKDFLNVTLFNDLQPSNVPELLVEIVKVEGSVMEVNPEPAKT